MADIVPTLRNLTNPHLSAEYDRASEADRVLMRKLSYVARTAADEIERLRGALSDLAACVVAGTKRGPGTRWLDLLEVCETHQATIEDALGSEKRDSDG